MPLSVAKTKLLAALLSEYSDKAAAVTCGISYKSALRWQEEPEFQQELSKAKNHIIDSALTQITNAVGTAAKQLNQLLDNPNLSVPHRIELIRYVLDFGIDLHQQQTLIARLETLERANTSGPATPWEPATVIEGERPSDVKQLC